MTGHHVRGILSAAPDMMTGRTGCPDIMSIGSDLRKQPRTALLDMMSGSTARHMIQARDLRKPALCHLPVQSADIMSDPTTPVTVGSGRRNP